MAARVGFFISCLLFSGSVLAGERIPGWDQRFYRLDLGPLPSSFVTGFESRPVPTAVASMPSGNFLVAGVFTNIQNQEYSNLALWDGTAWQQPLPNGQGRIALSPVPPQYLASGIFALAARGDEIFLGGEGIISAAETAVTNLAWWNGSAWSDMGGGTTGRVTAIVVDGSRVYAGGRFESIGGIAATNIAMWNGAEWSPLGDGVPFIPNDLTVFNGQPHAATLNTNVPHRMLRWNGSAWEPLANAFSQTEPGVPLALLTRPEGIYVGGKFSQVAGVSSTNVILWNGSAWQSLAGGIDTLEFGGRINSLASWQDKILAGGYLFGSSPLITRGPALNLWDGSSWKAITNSPVGAPLKLASAGERLFVLGEMDNRFTSGTVSAAYFDGLHWEQLGLSPGWLKANALAQSTHLVRSEGGLLVAGAEKRLARWNGGGWEHFAIRDDLYPLEVLALAAQGDSTWVGSPRPWWLGETGGHLAATDGTNWFNEGVITAAARSLAVIGSKVYVGTDRGVRIWNGRQTVLPSVEHPLQSISSLATDGEFLYTAGSTSFMGLLTISKFDGERWTVLADNLLHQPFPVRLKVIERELYAMGSFKEIGGKNISGLARWDGEQWQPVAPIEFLEEPSNYGMNRVQTLVSDGRGGLWIGGNFRVSGRTNIISLLRIGAGEPLQFEASARSGHAYIAEWWRGALYVAGFGFLNLGETLGAWHDPDAAVEAAVFAPTNVVSGKIGEVRLQVSNLRTTNVNDVRVIVPLPKEVSAPELPPNAALEGTNLVWHLTDIAPGTSHLAAQLRFETSRERDVEFRAFVEGPSVPHFRSPPIWTTVSEAQPPGGTILGFSMSTDGTWKFDFLGLAQSEYVIEKSADLVNWTPQLSFTNTNLTSTLSVPVVNGENSTFWRSRWVGPQAP